jgi:hypothetical protein
MDTLTYEFDDLPIIVEGGFEAGGLSGQAIINFHSDGDWFVDEIYLSGTKRIYVDGNFDRFEDKYLAIYDNTSWLYRTIFGQLTNGSFKDSIQDKVNSELEWSGISMPTDYEQHTTFYAALSGAQS